MQQNRSTEIKVGIVSIVGIILLIAGITLGKKYDVAVSRKTIEMKFPHSNGIENTAPVTVNGVERGTVTSIKNAGDSVLITAAINGIDDLHANAHARILIQEITGGKKIDISPGDVEKPFDASIVIRGEANSDLGEIIALIGSVSDNAASLVLKLDTLTGYATKLMRDEKFTYGLKKTVANAEEITSKMKFLLDNNVDELDMTLRNLKVLSQDLKTAVKENEPKLQDVLDNTDKTLEDTRALIANTENVIAKADKLVNEINVIASDFRGSDSFANKIMFDEEYSSKIDSVMKELNMFVEQLRKYGLNTNVRLGTRP